MEGTAPRSAEGRRLANRLKRARGQLGALITAVEDGADCRAVIIQLAAVRKALDKAGFELVSTTMRHRIAATAEARSEAADGTEPEEGTMTMDELRRLFLTLA
ncbi:metal-sensitive transcriptional regulator [Sinomonas terrae]|uniref:Metal-sensitive transcriptional regulator n=1 Tax=Sinomonas terrae TaxID=2908838 RepID=A0ABS9U575_9MICC|nr:metal-sensitive transcriptional regulator [Sinomonas terrae]MCH6471846.1 metal-sensitive transcriptional regulator [Sinomonas terrae]